MPIIAKNKTAKREYKILETYEAGIVLSGQEVKSVKGGHIDLKGSYVALKKGELWLINAHIPPYKSAGRLENYDSKQDRKLLISKKERKSLIGLLQQKGLTLVPLSVYTKRNLIKVEFGVGKGKKKADKRQDIKERETKRRIQRAKRR